jgi:hypothetical protein
MGERGVPVLHLLKVRRIAAQYGIPFNPVLTQAGFFPGTPTRGRYSKPLTFAGLALLLVLLVFMRQTASRGRGRLGDF